MELRLWRRLRRRRQDPTSPYLPRRRLSLRAPHTRSGTHCGGGGFAERRVVLPYRCRRRLARRPPLFLGVVVVGSEGGTFFAGGLGCAVLFCLPSKAESTPSTADPQVHEPRGISDKMAPPEQVADSSKNTLDKPPVPQQTPAISEKRRLKRKIGDTESAQDAIDSRLCSDEEPNSTPKARKHLCLEDSPDDDQVLP